MAAKKIGSLAVAVLGSIPLFWVQVGAAHADDRGFLHYLGGSVYADDDNLLAATDESGDACDESVWDFPGGPAYTGDKSYLGFDGCLENKNTGRIIPDAVVTMTGVGLPQQTRTDRNGNLRASSTSTAEEIRVTIKVAGYEPYSIIVFRAENRVSGRNVRPVFLLTPLPDLSYVGGAKGSLKAPEKNLGGSKVAAPDVEPREVKTGADTAGVVRK